MRISRQHYLKEFLNWFWLRPENAILLPFRAEKLASTMPSKSTCSLDVSCGDGVFSFITFGGQLSRDADMFQSIDTSNKRRGNHDAFDSFDQSYSVETTSSPAEFTFSHGTDWKKNLLSKAEKLHWYGNLTLHDNNTAMPFEDGSFDYVYSNSAYWVANFEQHISNLIKILKPGGTLVLELKTHAVKGFLHTRYARSLLGQRSTEILDAGRASTWHGLKSLAEYTQFLESLKDVQLTRREPIYGQELLAIWDVGLRPLFNPLAKLTQSVEKDIRRAVKQEWCEICYELSEHLVTSYSPRINDAGEWLFVLNKVA